MKQYKQLGNAADRLFSSLSQADMVTFVDYGSYRSKTPVSLSPVADLLSMNFPHFV